MALIKLQATFLDAIFKQGIGDPVREPCQPALPICLVLVLGADRQERPMAWSTGDTINTWPQPVRGVGAELFWEGSPARTQWPGVPVSSKGLPPPGPGEASQGLQQGTLFFS